MRLVIIGNGVAGVTTARNVADRKASIEVHLYTKEPYAYYPRPRLIDYISGKLSVENLPQYDDAWYQARGIDVHLSQQAMAVDPQARKVAFADGHKEIYDSLVLATGSRAWVPPIQGAHLQGVHTLRCLDDAHALCRQAEQGEPFLILGGGLLGLDTAMALRSYGVDVTVVELLPRLLPRQLDVEGAALLQQAIEARGVRVITGDACSEIEGDAQVHGARLGSGRFLPAGVVLISAGVRPKIDLAQEAGLTCHLGVVVDERMLTSAPAIYAVGDTAEFNGRVWGIIPAALAQARVAGAQITGQTDVAYQDVVPSTTLQVTGIDLTSVGEVNPEAGDYQEVRFLDEAAQIYKKLVIRENRIVGAILLGSRSDLAAVNQLVSRGIDVTEVQDQLLEPDFDLGAFVRRASARSA